MIATSIGIRAAVFGVIALGIYKVRPSTLLRFTEDKVVGAGKKVSSVVHRTKNEYRARMYAKATENIRRQDAEFEAMTPAQRAQATKDQAEVLARSAEILAERQAKRSGKAYQHGDAFREAFDPQVKKAVKNRRSSSAGRKA